MHPSGSVDYNSDERRWSLKRGLLEATVFGHSERLMTLTYGAARLESCSIYEPLLGGQLFRAQEMIARGPSVRLTAFAPSNDPVATTTDLDDPKQSLFHLRELTNALELHYKSLTGLPMGSVMFALDFAPGGVWETLDGAIRATPGQVLHLKEGRGRMRYGRDCVDLEIGELRVGARRLRDAPPAPEFVRLLIAFETPADESMKIRTYQENTQRWR